MFAENDVICLFGTIKLMMVLLISECNIFFIIVFDSLIKFSHTMVNELEESLHHAFSHHKHYVQACMWQTTRELYI